MELVETSGVQCKRKLRLDRREDGTAESHAQPQFNLATLMSIVFSVAATTRGIAPGMRQWLEQNRPLLCFLKGHAQTAAQAMNKFEDRRTLRFENGIHHQIAGGIQDSDGDRCLVNVQANILIRQGAPGCRW